MEDIFRLLDSLKNKIINETKKFAQYKAQPVIITSPLIRRQVKKFLETFLSQIYVISYNELEKQVNMKVIGVIDEN